MQILSKKILYSWSIALLACTAFTIGPAHGAASREVLRAVEEAARTHLLELATTAALQKPSVKVEAFARNADIPCTRVGRIDPIDMRSITRMRFEATCEHGELAEFIVRAVVSADVLVMTRDLRAKEPIDASMVTLAHRELSAIDDAISAVEDIDGKASRRALRRGQLLSRRSLIEPLLVERGAAVEIVARDVGVEVRVAGEALQAGHRGDEVEVRNVANGRVIRARVIGPNSVAPVDNSAPSR